MFKLNEPGVPLKTKVDELDEPTPKKFMSIEDPVERVTVGLDLIVVGNAPLSKPALVAEVLPISLSGSAT